jgi:hypothetical protein
MSEEQPQQRLRGVVGDHHRLHADIAFSGVLIGRRHRTKMCSSDHPVSREQRCELIVSARQQRQRLDPHLDELRRVGGVEHGVHLWVLAWVEPTALGVILLPRFCSTSVLAHDRESRNGCRQHPVESALRVCLGHCRRRCRPSQVGEALDNPRHVVDQVSQCNQADLGAAVGAEGEVHIGRSWLLESDT